MSDASCHSPTQPSKEGADVLADINANLNSNKVDSTLIFQSQQWTKKDETSNPITSERIFRDLDMQETFQNDEAG